MLLQGICCNVHVNTELLNCPVHLVLFNMSFSSEWLFDSLKFLLLLPALTIQNGNDLFVNDFALQARLTHKGNLHLSQQEMLALKYAARRWYWKYPTEPQLWNQLQDWGNLTSALSPASTSPSAGHLRRVDAPGDLPKNWGIFTGLADLTLAGADFKSPQSTPGILRLKHLAKEQKLPSQS